MHARFNFVTASHATIDLRLRTVRAFAAFPAAMRHADYLHLNLYACEGGFLLGPDVMHLPMAATERHRDISPLLATLRCADIPEALCQRICDDIDAANYAFLPIAA